MAERGDACRGGKMSDVHKKLLLLGIAEIYEEIAKSDENLAKWKERPREP